MDFGNYTLENRWFYSDYFVDVFTTKQMKKSEYEGEFSQQELKYYGNILMQKN